MLINRMSTSFPLTATYGKPAASRQPTVRAVIGFALGLLGMVALGFAPVIAILATLH